MIRLIGRVLVDDAHYRRLLRMDTLTVELRIEERRVQPRVGQQELSVVMR